ncbi:MAG: DVUA0089 family protein [Cyanobacteria bacterium P01_G01_bin.39]
MGSTNPTTQEELLVSFNSSQPDNIPQSNYSPSNSDRQPVLINHQTIQLQEASLDNGAFDLIGLTELRKDPQFSGIDGSGFSVAVIDTGIDRDHPLIAPNYVAGYDFIDNDNNPADTNGHGTHVSGIIGAVDPNIGVAPDVGLISLRAFGDNNDSFFARLEDSLEWVFNYKDKYNITAVNLSFGVGFYTPESLLLGDIISDDIRRLEEAGVTVVAASGNGYFTNSGKPNQANLTFPAINSTIAVGAVWHDGTQVDAAWGSGSIDYSTGADRIASFSQRLDAPHVLFAPGAIITSTKIGGGTGRRGGTSQAAPHVAGAVALLQEASMQFNGSLLTPQEVTEILRTTGEAIVDGDDEDDNVSNTNDTYFRINLYNAVAEVKRRSGKTVVPFVGEDANGTIPQAVRGITLNDAAVSPIRGKIGFDGNTSVNNDVDLYRFQVLASGVVKIKVASDLINPDDFDSYLRLFDSSGKQLAVNDDIDSSDAFSQIEVNLKPNTYYVGVSGSNNISYDPNIAGSGTEGDTGNYTLEFSRRDLEANDLLGEDDFNTNPDNEVESGSEVHRFFNLQTGIHFYTSSTVEKDFVQDNLEHYLYEGVSFAGAQETLESAKPVHRFFNLNTGGHLYTISEVERDVLDDLTTYNYEGIAYYGFERARPGATPLYRFYNSVTDAHFYTSSANEKDAVLANLPDFQLEGQVGAAFYVESV